MNSFYPSIPDFSIYRFLVTGGAGFIGSHVVDFLIQSQAKEIVVLDNLSTGKKENIEAWRSNSKIKFLNADITNYEQCESASKGIDIIVHLAALGSVPRSITDPLSSHNVNSTGFLNILWAAKSGGVQKVVYASSSSVYGNSISSPKKEGEEGEPLSPYAFTKVSNEKYAALFNSLYGLTTVGLRFFNIFGSRQNKDGPYAAFIPLALDAAINNSTLKIYGDGTQSRDFTHVSNAVWAIKSAIEATQTCGAYNVAGGEGTKLVEVVELLQKISGKFIKVLFEKERLGDIKNSLADLNCVRVHLGYEPILSFEKGLKEVYQELKK